MSSAEVLGHAQCELNDNAAGEVRDLARQGALADRMAAATGAEYTRLSGGVYDIAWPVVFERLTRRVERRRGHSRCAVSVKHMEPDCLDRFQEDVEAILDDVGRNAKVPIHNLEGWITSRLTAATVDGHRRRRGERGALQRPRLPDWLADALGRDCWLTALAVEILVWVGVPATAGTGIWPCCAWADRRAALTGDRSQADAEVAKDIDVVLAAMRRNPRWYERFVERPLGRKQAPLLPSDGADTDWLRERPRLASIQRQESDDARLRELAALAVAAIEAGLARGGDPRTVVLSVLRTAFGPGTGAEDLDCAPGTGPTHDRWIAWQLADERSIDRIVSAVLAIIAPR